MTVSVDSTRQDFQSGSFSFLFWRDQLALKRQAHKRRIRVQRGGHRKCRTSGAKYDGTIGSVKKIRWRMRENEFMGACPTKTRGNME